MKKETEDTGNTLKLCNFCKVKCDNDDCELITNSELLDLFRKSKFAKFNDFLEEIGI